MLLLFLNLSNKKKFFILFIYLIFMNSLTKYELMLNSMTVRGLIYYENLIDLNLIKNKINNLIPKYPWLTFQIKNEIFKNNYYPIFYEKEFLFTEKLEFVSNILSDCKSMDFISFWRCFTKNSNNGAVLIIINHSIIDGVHLSNFISDFLEENPKIFT